MKIPQQYKQCQKRSILAVVTGQVHVKIYAISNGQMNELDEIMEETESYSDKEGFFARSGGGKFYGAGGPDFTDVKEEKTQKAEKKIVKKVKEETREKKWTDIVLIASQEQMSNLGQEIDRVNEDKATIWKIVGNHTNDHSTKILEIIDKRMSEWIEQIPIQKEEARRIIEK